MDKAPRRNAAVEDTQRNRLPRHILRLLSSSDNNCQEENIDPNSNNGHDTNNGRDDEPPKSIPDNVAEPPIIAHDNDNVQSQILVDDEVELVLVLPQEDRERYLEALRMEIAADERFAEKGDEHLDKLDRALALLEEHTKQDATRAQNLAALIQQIAEHRKDAKAQYKAASERIRKYKKACTPSRYRLK